MSPATMPAWSSGRCCSGIRPIENRHIIPRVTFTDPEIAHVGLTEAEAVGRKLAIRILRWPFAENDRAQAERKTAGTSRWWWT